jgi:carbon storage regulator
MLVFRRQIGESFFVGDNVEIRILEVRRGQVKVGIVAPREISIRRTELSKINRLAVVENWADPETERSLRQVADWLTPRGGAI